MTKKMVGSLAKGNTAEKHNKTERNDATKLENVELKWDHE